jgi:hypothetical protein
MAIKGGARPGSGRPPGKANKRSQEIQDRLDALECDPIEGMAMIAMDPNTDDALKLQCYKELAQYIAPKRKAIDMEATMNGQVTIEVVRFSELEKNDEDTSTE